MIQLAGKIFAFSLFLMPTLLGTTQASDRPNMLLVIADDMGLDASLCYSVGDQQARMPTIESLCRSGMVFENAYAAPTCSPTRATIMTGKFGFRTGVGGAITPDNDVGLSSDEISLFDLLNEANYASALIGKWHLAGSSDPLDHPEAFGVDHYFGFFKGRMRDYYEWDAVEDGTPLSVSGYATTILTDAAIDWIGGQQSPWFLWLAYSAPHTPFHAPPDDLHSYGDLPTDRRSIRDDRLTYFNASLEALDTELGRLLDAIPSDQRDKTIVMFIGDNGSPGQVARGLYGERGAKGGIFEGGTHVPLIVSGDGVMAGRSDALVNSTDLFATIADLAGVETLPDGAGIDSISFKSALFGGEGRRELVYVEHFSDAEPRGGGTLGWAVRDNDYKLVGVEGEDLKLFDLDQDPLETTDLLRGNPNSDIQSIAARLENARPE